MTTDIERIHNFWLGDIEDGFSPPEKNKLWYAGGEEIDSQIKENFGALLTQAENKKLNHWSTTIKGRLALIILLDQFSRNIYRGSADAFKNDPQALDIALDGINKKEHLSLTPVEQSFLYMPLEHSESLENQNLCVELFTALKKSLPVEKTEGVQGWLDYAVIHRDIVEKFGRFPHRNKILERESTQEEIDYLTEGGHTFGQ